MERWRAKKFTVEPSLPEALNNPGCNLLSVAVDCHFFHCGLSRRLMMIDDRPRGSLRAGPILVFNVDYVLAYFVIFA
jgi:hypothetical protein